MDSILSAAQPPQPSSKDTGSEFAEFGIFLTVGSLPTTSAGQIARGVKIFDCRHRESVGAGRPYDCYRWQQQGRTCCCRSSQEDFCSERNSSNSRLGMPRATSV